ncbi:uncharacterized protein LOC115928576 [Strongylocentrotus purpuratus]|uniref:Endonuclease/exonuclease/phosphatase domain-containing protein n=1 Tax=Strongylocentrotus purpuratus TaxID=7668 RepID=A0A7M7PJV3_STRPU|nr:uncharacterized protein LOC115928576 [Strongylocentrotus purpuratus]
MCTLNARSVRNKTTDIVEFVLDNDFDILALTETWLKDDDDVYLGNCIPEGYTFNHKDRQGKGGGGVGLLFKSSLSVKSEAVQHFMSFEAYQARVSCQSRSLILLVIYRPDIVEEQGQRIPYSLFLEEFATLLDSFVLDPSEVVLTGDFNVWVDDFNDVRARQFMNILSSYGMKQLVREGTHLHGHTLDLLITRDSATLVSDVSVILGVSDHHAVQCNLDLRKPSTSRRTVTTRPLRSMNREQFRSGVHESLSEIDIEDSSISSSVERYDLSLTSLLDKLAPKKTRSVIIKPSSPWMTEKIHAAKCLRRRLERKWRRTRSEEDRKSYVTQRQVVSQEIEKAKTEYYSECVAECEGNQRRLFTVVDALLHRKKETVLPDASSDQILADNFCHYFFNKVTKIRDDIDAELSSGQCTAL